MLDIDLGRRGARTQLVGGSARQGSAQNEAS